jgi:ubiquinol-cytochrome c reductase cytochrome b/c1 subunit
VISRVATTWYFLHFLILLPLVGKIERPRQLPDSIRTPVLGAGGGAGQSATTDRVR